MSDDPRDQPPSTALAIREQKTDVSLSTASAAGAALVGLVGLVEQGRRSRTQTIRDAGETSDDRSTDFGSGERSGRATGSPPNVSGDPRGYNTKLFPGVRQVRLALYNLGLEVLASDEPLTSTRDRAALGRFQRDWNRVVRGIAVGRLKRSGWRRSFPEQLRGLLDTWGVDDHHTRNAIEIAFTLHIKAKIDWHALRKQVRS